MRSFSNVVLALSGLALFYACTMRLIDPSAVVFLQGTGNAPTVEMANEIRGIGAEMLLGGIVAFVGILIPRFRMTSFVLLSVIFVGMVLGRSVSWVVDGVPDANISRALQHEAILAVLNVSCLAYLLIKDRETQGRSSAPAKAHARTTLPGRTVETVARGAGEDG